MSARRIPLELLCWLGAILLFALAKPGEHHFSLCPIANLGWSWCPGCGLGRSIISILHGDFRHSLTQHWLGFPAVIILSHRIVRLSQQFVLSLKS